MSVLASPEYVSEGSRVVWTGQFGSTATANTWALTSSGMIQDVSAVLWNSYKLAVEKSDNGLSWGGLSGGSVTLYLRTDQDRGDGEVDDGLTDILNNVSDAFKQIGFPCVNCSINKYTPADNSSRGTVNTGTPLATVQQQTANDKPSPSWWDQFIGKVEAGSMGFILGGVAVVALIVVVVVKSEVP